MSRPCGVCGKRSCATISRPLWPPTTLDVEWDGTNLPGREGLAWARRGCGPRNRWAEMWETWEVELEERDRRWRGPGDRVLSGAGVDKAGLDVNERHSRAVCGEKPARSSTERVFRTPTRRSSKLALARAVSRVRYAESASVSSRPHTPDTPPVDEHRSRRATLAGRALRQRKTEACRRKFGDGRASSLATAASPRHLPLCDA